MLVMKFKGAVLQNQETLAEIKNRIKEQNCCSIVKWVKITENRKIERFVRYSASCRSIA